MARGAKRTGMIMGKVGGTWQYATTVWRRLQHRIDAKAILSAGEAVTPADFPVAWTPMGCSGLEQSLGILGYPNGHITEILGPPESGKTSLALHAIAACQRAGGVCAIVDASHTLTVCHGSALGVDVKRLLVTRPACAEQAWDICQALLDSRALAMLVVDCIAALAPRRELERRLGTRRAGEFTEVLRRGLRQCSAAARRTGCVLLCIDESHVGAPFYDVLPFYTALRLELARGDACAADQEQRLRLRVAHNKFVQLSAGQSARVVELTLAHGRGLRIWAAAGCSVANS